MDNKDFENIYKSSNQIDSINNETFFVIRKAKGEKFDPTSYAKVVSRLDFDSAPMGDYAIEEIIKATANCGNCEHRQDCVYEHAWNLCDKWNLYSTPKED